MDMQVMICFAITILLMVLFIWDPYKSIATTTVLGVVLFFITGCVDEEVVVSSFGNTTGILTCTMFVVTAGFNKTQFVKTLAQTVQRLSKGSLTLVLLGYSIIGLLLVQFIPSILVVFCVMAPMLAATVETMGYSPSRVMFPYAALLISCVVCMPIGSGATEYAIYNTQLEALGSEYRAGIFDPFMGRWPVLVAMFIYCIFIAPRFTPKEPVAAIMGVEEQDTKGRAKAELEKPKLNSFQEASALIIFFGVTLALIIVSTVELPIQLDNWVVTMAGALLMIFTGVLKPKEASRALPIWVWLMFVGGLVMAGALTNTGAGEIIGNTVAALVNTFQNTFMYYILLCVGPYICTNFLNNRTTTFIFYPIAIQVCEALGANPIGSIICVMAATQSAFILPTATSTVVYAMGAGGYDLKTMLKMGWFPTLLIWVVLAAWLSIIYPVF
ncbi:anion permease [Collinsella tanakaei]|uniref:SLC13 family permease n=1 Tax=Collinsella ihumii TaxID=1720204 RepID=A0AAW7K0M2_9ACTN|nr:SLC13 family permease [Collinsella ihumii]MBM6777809.1 anion permease [Collinsella tanakaei]MBM6785747.1 anion permease [Collinsella tanakaei]MDN0063415.1 SLC13 family permease [Collinsella ihumii]MDN0070250.1 SLC13 family permease [Collinsella ihumii]